MAPVALQIETLAVGGGGGAVKFTGFLAQVNNEKPFCKKGSLAVLFLIYSPESLKANNFLYAAHYLCL